MLSIFWGLITALIISGPDGYQPGDIAGDFTLPDVNGEQVTMSSAAGEAGCFLIFTCNVCPYAKLNVDRIVRLHEAFAPLGLPVIAVNPNDSKRSPGDSYNEMKKHARDGNYPFPYLHDETQEVARRFGASRTPQVYLLQRGQDEFRVRYVGAIDDSPSDPAEVEVTYVENAAHAMLNGQNPDPTITKSIGWTIKWRL